MPAVVPTPERRDAAVERLSAAFARDLLTTEELERRVAAAYGAATLPELDALTRDLPADGVGTGASSAPGEEGPAPLVASAVFSSVERRGRGSLPGRLLIRATFGNVEWDFRDADFVEGVTVIEVQALCGNVELEFSGDVDVEVEGTTFLGRFAVERSRSGPGGAGGPSKKVRVVGRATLSNVEVEVEPARRRGNR